MNSFTSQKFRFYSFLSMFLLVYVHGYNLTNTYLQPWGTVHEPMTFTTFFEYFTANGLFRFRIPMLFIISGYLFALGDTKPYPQRIGKRARTLLLPYLLWSAIGLALTFLLQQNHFTAQFVREAQIDQMGDNRSYAEIGWSGMLPRWLLVPVSFQLWFLRCLFMYNLLYPLIRFAVLRIPYIWFPIVIFLWLTTFGAYLVEGEGLFFFSLGIWVAKKNFNIENPPRWLNLKLIFPMFLLYCTSKTVIAFYMADGLASFIILSLLHKVTVFTGLVSVWYGADKLVHYLMNKKWFSKTTAFSFFIYGLHVPLICYATRFAFRYVDFIPSYRLVVYLLLPLVVAGICVAAGALARKVLPKAYSVLTGGRGL